MKRVLCCMLLLALMCGAVQAKDWGVSALTSGKTDRIETRIEKNLDSVWSVGGFGTWYKASDEPSKDWGVGAFAKLAVDPNADIPLANWLPKIGAWLHIPETIKLRTYLIGKGEIVPAGGGVDFVLGVGPGVQAGPVTVEWLYQLVESGNADNPYMFSQGMLFVGIEPIRF